MLLRSDLEDAVDKVRGFHEDGKGMEIEMVGAAYNAGSSTLASPGIDQKESTVVTTRQVLEKMAISFALERIAWKILKDAPRSAMRKVQQGMSTPVYFFSISRMTLRATWIVQFGIEIYRSLSHLFDSGKRVEYVDLVKELHILGRKFFISL